MRRLALVLVALPVAALAQGDPLPVRFLPGDNGSEGCYAQWATRSAVEAHSAPTAVSEAIRTVEADRRIDANDYSETLTATLRPGAARALEAVAVEAQRLATEEPAALRLEAGDEVLVVGFGAEGSLFLEHEGRTYGAFLEGYHGGGGPFEALSRPVSETWVRLVEHAEDRPAAWVNTDQAGMVPREPYCL